MDGFQSGPSPCNPGGPPNLTNLLCTPSTNQGSTVTVDVRGGTNGVAYNILRATNLAVAVPGGLQGVWLGQGFTCQTYTFTNQPSKAGFYWLGLPQTNDLYGSMVVAWGDDSLGQCNVPGGLLNVTAVAGGMSHSLALQGYGGQGVQGFVAAWGDNSHGQTAVPAGLSNVVAIAAGGYHNLALRADGSVAAWGQWQTESFTNVTVPGEWAMLQPLPPA